VDLTRELGRGPIALDTAVFIYFIEEHPRHLRTVEGIFGAIDAGELEAVTSALTLLEVLVLPYRVGDLALAERYETLLRRSRGLRMVELDAMVLRGAAQLRARLRIKTPDAIQLAAALSTRCTTLVTGDRRLPHLPGLRVVQLSALGA
jgi:predicted nucleic acid-binding protein